jgi:ferredoxin--NADP+ reductase
LVERQAYGFLTLDRFSDGRDLWLLASGTGIAPFLSILQEPEVWQRFAQVRLLYSVRHAEEQVYRALLDALPGRDYLGIRAGQWQYLVTLTGEQQDGCLHGRLTRLLATGELERAAGLALQPEHSRLMVCGNPQMIEDTRESLRQRDLQLALTRRPGQVAVENYW